MEALRKFIIAMFGFVICIGIGIVTMIYGWGLYPKSWWIVIFANTIGFIIGQLTIALAKAED